MRNIKLTIEYDGTGYCGWQRQPNGVSIEGTLENAVKKIINEDIRIIGSSRTDSGVHAKGQVANFFTSSCIPVNKIPSAINSKLPNDIKVVSAEEAGEDFHSRYNSKGKLYSYRIFNRNIPPAYMRNYAAHCAYPLDFENMEKACTYFVGTHDFNAFKSSKGSAKTSIRTIRSIKLLKEGELIVLLIEGDSFLYNMVRIIAGTLIEVGRGKILPDSMPDIIECKDRNRAGKTAPASGLCLEKVFY